MDLIGQTLGAYRISAEVAQGGQATLYKAEHTVLGRETALKMLHPHLITVADFLEKFEAESKILAQLNHPNIVAVYDAGMDQGQYWIAMEWLDGQTVDELIAQQGKLPVDQAVRIADQVAAALEYAHSQGLIHRDIKPSNMMLLSDGTVKVLDFGIAAIVAAGQKAKTRIGTVEYMSYQQFQGQADQRSDLYSLGASLYEMLTGQLPPRLSLHPLTPPRQLNPAIPQELDRFLQSALIKEADNRPQTAQLFRKKMRDTHNATVTQSAPAIQCPYCGGQNRGTARYCRDCGKPLTPKLNIGMGPLQIADIGRIVPPMKNFEPKFRWSPDGRILAAVLKYSVLFQFHFDPLPQSVTQIGGYEAFSMKGTPVATQTIPEWSPDSTKIAYVSPEDHKIGLRSTKGPDTEKLTWGEDTDDDMPRWSPDGQLLLYRSTVRTTGRQQWRLIDLNTKQILQTGSEVKEYAWSPNGSYLACGSRLGGIQLYDRSGNSLDRHTPYTGDLKEFGWMDTKRIIAVYFWTFRIGIGEPGNAMIMYDIESKKSHELLVEERQIDSFAISPNQQWVAVTTIEIDWEAYKVDWKSYDYAAGITLAATRNDTILELQATKAKSKGIAVHGWSPDSSKILFTQGEEIWTVNTNDTGLQRLAEGYAPQWSPDGRHIAFLRSPEQGKYELWVMRVEPA